MNKLPTQIYFLIAFFTIVIFDAYNVAFSYGFNRTIATLIILPLLLVWYFNKVYTYSYFYMLSFLVIFIGAVNYIGSSPKGYLIGIGCYAVGLLLYIFTLKQYFKNVKKVVLIAVVSILVIAVFSPFFKLPFSYFGNWIIRAYVFLMLVFTGMSVSHYLSSKHKHSKLLLTSGVLVFITTCGSAIMMFLTATRPIEFITIILFWSYHLFMCLFMIEADRYNKETQLLVNA